MSQQEVEQVFLGLDGSLLLRLKNFFTARLLTLLEQKLDAAWHLELLAVRDTMLLCEVLYLFNQLLRVGLVLDGSCDHDHLFWLRLTILLQLLLLGELFLVGLASQGDS